jgi:anti-sigma B factor antagonist
MSLSIDVKYNEKKENWEVDLVGDLDINSSVTLKDRLNEILDQREADIAFKIRDLAYIDSTGLGVMISLLNRLDKNEKAMVIMDPQENVLKIFKITGLDKVIKISKEGESIEG